MIRTLLSGEGMGRLVLPLSPLGAAGVSAGALLFAVDPSPADGLIHTLSNLGGLSLFATGLFVLLREQLKAFQDQVSAERKRTDELIGGLRSEWATERRERGAALEHFREEFLRHHEELLAQLHLIRVETICQHQAKPDADHHPEA